MSEAIPERVDLIKAARQSSQYSGTYSISRMQRLAELLADDSGLATVNIKFDMTGQKDAYLSGTASADVVVYCQRCMQPMSDVIEADFQLRLMENEDELESLPEEVDAYHVAEVPSSLLAIIEDELILAKPLISMHPPYECDATEYLKDRQVKDDRPDNPFEALKDLKIDG